MPDGTYDFSPYPEQPEPRYTSFARGVVGGLVDDIYTRQSAQRKQESDARSNALKFLQTLPMSEQNAPIVTRMALDILASKPGQKHWTDQVFGTGRATNKFVDDIWGKLKSILPGEPERMPMPERAVATRPRTALAENPSPYGARAVPTQIGESPMAEIPQPPFKPADRSKISFANLPGRYQRDPTVFYDKEGNATTFAYDVTGQRQQPIPYKLGQYTTERQNIAQTQAEAKMGAAREAMSKGLMKNVFDAAAQDGVNPQTFWQMPFELQQPYYAKAGLMGMETTLGKAANVQSSTEVNKARVPEIQARTRLFDRTVQAGGATPGERQQIGLYQQRAGRAQEFQQKFNDKYSELLAAQQEMNALKSNPYFGMMKDLPPSSPVAKTFRELTGKVTRLQEEVNSMSREGQTMHKEFLTPGRDGAGNPTLQFNPQAPTLFQGGANSGAMMRPQMPQVTPQTPAQQRATDIFSLDRPVGATTVTPSQYGQIGGPGATVAPPAPKGPFPKGTPPSVTMKLGQKGGTATGAPTIGKGAIVVPGTVKNPASGFTSGEIVPIGNKQYKVGRVTKPDRANPYGTVELIRME